jgi:hypothetical protein
LDRRIKPASGPARGAGPAAPVNDWGQGLHASAQREILEVLLNEPGLFHRVDQAIAPDLFDVPSLAPIAAILLDAVRSGEDFSLGAVLARVESVEVGERIVELQRVGEEKGNYHSRLVDALRVLRRRPDHSAGVRTHGGGLGQDSPPSAEQPAGRQNPHSLGMV